MNYNEKVWSAQICPAVCGRLFCEGILCGWFENPKVPTQSGLVLVYAMHQIPSRTQDPSIEVFCQQRIDQEKVHFALTFQHKCDFVINRLSIPGVPYIYNHIYVYMLTPAPQGYLSSSNWTKSSYFKDRV